jgi:hypothetical protein
VSTDGGGAWGEATLEDPVGAHAWRRWTFAWEAQPGYRELVVRAADDSGRIQPLEEPWNHHGLANNLVQRVPVRVRGSDPD